MAEPDETSEERLLTRRLRSRGVNVRCPACDWTLDGPIGDYRLVPEHDADETIAVRRAVKVRIFACRNCGYIRLHSANVLTDIGV